MQIIIVGCGKVGYTLVEHLSGEEHNLIVIDTDEKCVNKVTYSLDAMGIVGNGCSYQTLMEANIEQTDLFIAVTNSDEQNLLCCLVAKKAGNCKTIARIRNPLYYKEAQFLKKEFGLAMIINPELATAAEIARIFRFPSAIKIDTFAKGRIELLRFRIKSGSLLHGMKVIDIREKLGEDVLVCMIIRKDQVIIPNGNVVLQEGDVVGIVAEPQKAGQFFRKVKLDTKRVHDVFIVGGGKISYYLARRLLTSGIKVKIIEQNFQRCEELSEALPNADIICGDGTDQDFLLEEGLAECEGFAALTNLDEENILLSLFAQTKSNAKRVTKINRISFDEVIDQMNLDSLIYPKLITADYITQYARSMHESFDSNMENLYKLADGRTEALEFIIKEKSPLAGIPLEKLKIKKDILICGINRNGRIIIPRGQDTIEVGDTVIIVLSNYRLYDIKDILED